MPCLNLCHNDYNWGKWPPPQTCCALSLFRILAMWSLCRPPVLSSHVPSLWHVNEWRQMSLFVVWLSVRAVGTVWHDSPNRNDKQWPMLLFFVWLPCRRQWRGTWIPHDRFCPLVVVWVHGQLLAFAGGWVCCTSWWALGTMWWLMEERKNVTCCDIHVMFKLTREIRWIFSHDNHIFAVNTPSPGPSLAEVKFSPQGWPQSCQAQPLLSYQFNMAILPLKSTSYRGTIKTSQCQPHNLVCHQHQEMVRMTITMTHLWQGRW